MKSQTNSSQLQCTLEVFCFVLILSFFWSSAPGDYWPDNAAYRHTRVTFLRHAGVTTTYSTGAECSWWDPGLAQHWELSNNFQLPMYTACLCWSRLYIYRSSWWQRVHIDGKKCIRSTVQATDPNLSRMLNSSLNSFLITRNSSIHDNSEA